MAKTFVKDAPTFLLAIMEATGGKDLVPDAIEWLQREEERICSSLDGAGKKGRERDRILLYTGMLRGLVLQMRKIVLYGKSEFQDANILNPDGTVKES